MSKRAFIAACGGMVLAGAVQAADLPSRLAPVFAPPPPLTFSWTGAYVGGTVGYGFTDQRPNVTLGRTPAAQFALAALGFGAVRTDSGGFVGGGGLGFNYQAMPGAGLVVGLEADVQYTDLNRRRDQSSLFGPFGLNATTRQSLDFLGTVRGRVGYAFDRVLVYGTGGLAYGNVFNEKRYDLLVGTPATFPLLAGRADRIETGFVYGGGIEYAVPTGSAPGFIGAGALTVRAEFLHYDLGQRTLGVTGVGALALLGTPALSRFSTEGNLVRLGLNYKFGWN